MKLVEKKCPRCGAGLSFNSNDKEVMCPYCRAKYEIDRTETGNTKNNYNPNNYNLNTIKKVGTKVIVIAVFTVALIMFIVIATIVIRSIKPATSYIKNSKKQAYVSVAKEYIKGTRYLVNSGQISTYSSDTTYYVPIKCINTVESKNSPYGKFVEAYVAVKYDNDIFRYYWISNDSTNHSIPKLTEESKLNDASVVNSKEKLDLNQKINGTEKILVLDSGNCLSFNSNN